MTVDLGTLLVAIIVAIGFGALIRRAPNELVAKMLDRLADLTTTLKLLVDNMDARPCCAEVQAELAAIRESVGKLPCSRSNGADPQPGGRQ